MPHPGPGNSSSLLYDSGHPTKGEQSGPGPSPRTQPCCDIAAPASSMGLTRKLKEDLSPVRSSVFIYLRVWAYTSPWLTPNAISQSQRGHIHVDYPPATGTACGSCCSSERSSLQFFPTVSLQPPVRRFTSWALLRI